MIRTQLRLPEEVKAWIDEGADREQRTMNSQIVWILRQAMAAEAAEHSEPAGDLVAKLARPPAAPSRGVTTDERVPD